MNILDFFRGKPRPWLPSTRVRELVDGFIEELNGLEGKWRPTAADLPSHQAILDSTPAEQVEVLPLLAAELRPVRSWTIPIVTGLTGAILRRKLALTEGDVIRIADRVDGWKAILPPALVVATIESYVAEHGLSEALRETVTLLRRRLSVFSHSTSDRRVLGRLELLLGGTNSRLFGASDEWTVVAAAEIQALEPAQQAAWRELLLVARLAPAKPSQKWLEEMRAQVDRLGAEHVRDAMRRWLPLFDQPKDRDLPDAPNLDALRGLIFAAALVADSSLPPLLANAAERAFRKIPGIGVLAAKIGNACVTALAEIGSPEAIAQLRHLRGRVEVVSAEKAIDHALERFT